MQTALYFQVKSDGFAQHNFSVVTAKFMEIFYIVEAFMKTLSTEIGSFVLY